MRRFRKLDNLQAFLKDMSIDSIWAVKPVMVVSSGDAVKHLSGAAHGMQVLVSYPEDRQTGGADEYVSRISVAIFVLEKDQEAAKTKESEAMQYAALLDLADAVVETIVRATEPSVISGHRVCPPLSGLELESVDIVPELSLFGGWNGYSIEMIFR